MADETRDIATHVAAIAQVLDFAMTVVVPQPFAVTVYNSGSTALHMYTFDEVAAWAKVYNVAVTTTHSAPDKRYDTCTVSDVVDGHIVDFTVGAAGPA